MRAEFLSFDLSLKLHKKTKRILVPEQPNGMDSASAIASPSSLLTPTGRKEHDF